MQGKNIHHTVTTMKPSIKYALAIGFSVITVNSAYAGDISNFFKTVSSNIEEESDEFEIPPLEIDRHTRDEYEDEAEDILTSATLDALKETHIGQELSELEDKLKRYSKVSFVGSKDEVKVYTDQHDIPKKKEPEMYEFSLGIDFDDYRLGLKAEFEYGPMELNVNYDRDDGIDSEMAYSFDF